ncbi:hypothetical protein N665_0093s0060 [Sinapis alba]|nr:hypothetical protein N665_0093s0060 [Sinapis alba]
MAVGRLGFHTSTLAIKNNAKKRLKCGERGLNTRPSDLQSDALPTELSPQHGQLKIKFIGSILLLLFIV